MDQEERIVSRTVKRRAALAFAASLACRPPALGAPTALPGTPTILVAGPQGGAVDDWAVSIAQPLGRSLLHSEAVGREHVGGADGVTGANHFQASTAPDGATALLMPGRTSLAWLVGDQRVRFDAGNWTPLWGGTVSVIAAIRTPLVRGRPVRVAVDTFAGPELAALLALELLGYDAVAVADGPAPFDREDIDLVMLRGAGLKHAAPELAARRWTTAFSLGTVAAEGRLARDPAFPDAPTALERVVVDRGVGRPKELVAALRAVCAAATLDVALVLPLLAPAAIVAWWRQGCTGLASAPEVQDEAAHTAVHPIDAGIMAASMGSIAADPAALLELRRWLADRHQYRPG